MIFKDLKGNTDAASTTNVPTRKRKNNNILGGGSIISGFSLFARDLGNYPAN
jgi:hypothetical protein